MTGRPVSVGRQPVRGSAIVPAEYDAFRSFLEEACGITLGENKHYLISSRLQRVMAEFEIAGLGELVQHLKRNRNSRLRSRIVDAMTTNETLWFRDRYPFEILSRVILPEFAQQSKRNVRIWSAACSSGQEPYTISMVVDEFQQQQRGAPAMGVRIMATDISATVLQEAREAIYDKASLARGVSAERQRRFFSPVGERWRVNDDVRQRVTFSELNLQDNYAALGRFDVVFCRNVLIYFSSELKRAILAKIAKSLNPGGYLFLGASESLAKHSDAFEMLRSHSGVYYRLK